MNLLFYFIFLVVKYFICIFKNSILVINNFKQLYDLQYLFFA
jgi:hypothetical protein